MRTFLRKLRGALGLALTWTIAWAALGAVIGTIDSVLRPTGGESPWHMAKVLGSVGFVSGLTCAVAIASLERRRQFSQLSLMRVALWGALGGATIPLLTAVPESQLLWTCPFGALLAAGSLGLARRGQDTTLPPSQQAPLLLDR